MSSLKMKADIYSLSKELNSFELFLKNYFKKRLKPPGEEGLKALFRSIEYTLFAPCKRFRPALAILSARALGLNYRQCFPAAAAIELIHTASLIHDDLPPMDNDQKRRGKPANHLVFKEDIALLSGDSLLVEPFYLLSFFKQKLKVIQIVSQAAGLSAMMGGQAVSLRFKKSTAVKKKIYKIYKMKTGALIEASIGAVLSLHGRRNRRTIALENFGRVLGLAFQLADDLQDGPDESVNILQVLERAPAEKELKKLTAKSLSFLKVFKEKERKPLENLVLFNQERAMNLPRRKQLNYKKAGG